ncbi:MAG: hypothetical protein WCB12_18120 [Bryobacteraceae bacterium]
MIEEFIETRLRDQRYVTLETSVAVAERLRGWVKLFLYFALVPLLLLLVVLGMFGVRSYNDFTSRIRAVQEAARERLEKKASEVTQALNGAQQTVAQLQEATAHLQSDVGRYQRVNQAIEKLQQQLTDVKGKVLDLGNRDVRAGSFSTPADEPASWHMGRIGCVPLGSGEKLGYCAEGSPPMLFQLGASGEKRPVSSLSSTGFQDASVGSKPACYADKRGTFYVEKGGMNVADRPFVCVKRSDNTYAWIGLAPAQ